uniref:CSON013433 protein n=1 Tax=Culicoides sonorensis TaxID=179676 RepID=A0A336MDJ0_CULSO
MKSSKHESDGPNEMPPVKRTKRRRRENPSEIMNQKYEEKIERKPPQPSVTPLPGFQEAFGSTEIGRFSDAFFNVLNSSPYYEPNNESDIDTLSPQPWETGDSLEGPHFNLQVGASFTPVYDNYSVDGSPLDNYFSELSCNEF